MSNHPEQLWNRCLSVIKDNISEAAYNTWFSPIIPLKYENNVFVGQHLGKQCGIHESASVPDCN
jgi:chromosomal replication initiator protein